MCTFELLQLQIVKIFSKEIEDWLKALSETLASTWRLAFDGMFPTILLAGAEGGLPMVGQEIHEKNEITKSGNCMRKDMHNHMLLIHFYPSCSSCNNCK